MNEEGVNKGKWAYFFVGFFGMTVFFGAFVLVPRTVFAPLSDVHMPQTSLSNFGKPLEEDPVDEPLSTRLVFTGDIMLARAVEWTIRTEGSFYPFLLWDHDMLTGADAVIGNFEGTIRETERIEQTNVMAFDTLPEYIPALADAGFTHLSLSNNHADDFGQATTDFTRMTLSEGGVTPFGDPFSSEAHVTRILGDIPVSLLGFHAFNEDATSLLSTIQEEDAAGNFVIVYPHWGNEYEHHPSSAQITAAELWIAAGADLIIGAHPHVVQRAEIIHDVPIVYSLGNFLFDQDFSRATQVGAVLDVTISQDDIALVFSPVEIQGRQMFVNHTEDAQLLSWLGLSELTWMVPRAAGQTP